MRYIDADKLQRHGNRGGVVYWRDIEAQPTADVVEVVRCSNCTHWENGRCYLLKDITVEVRDNDFCSYGERAEE